MQALAQLLPIAPAPTVAEIRSQAQMRAESLNLDTKIQELAGYCLTRSDMRTGTFGVIYRRSSMIRAMGRTWEVVATDGASDSLQLWINGQTVYRSEGAGRHLQVIAFRVGPWVDALDSAISAARVRSKAAIQAQEATEIFQAFAPVNV